MRRLYRIAIAATVALIAAAVLPPCARAQATAAPAPAAVLAEHNATELAKKTQNPISDLISLPFQFNFNGGGDLLAASMLNLNFQPVFPFRFSDDWNIIARSIVPIDSFPAANGERQSGFGDIQQQLYLTPSKPGSFIWGVGPMLSLPTATVAPAETGSWGLGPGAVVVKLTGPWVIGAVFQQFWTIADVGGDPEINFFFAQPFINYNLRDGWAVSTAPAITANWNGGDAGTWTLPLGIGITRTTVFNRRPMNIGVQYYYNAVRPDGAAGYTLRFVIAPLYPRAK